MQQEALQAFLGRFVADLGATGAAGGVVVGHRLGLYRSLAEGAATPEQLADRADCHPRYIGEWLRGQAAGGYVDYDPSTGRFSLDEVQAFCLADPNGPNMPAAFLAAVGYLRAEPQLSEAFRTGDGISWGEHSEDVFVGTDAFYRPGYIAELVPTWIPALEGVHERLTDGGRIADIGCGLGTTSVLLAEAYPNSTIVGLDNHTPSIELARKRAADAGVAARVNFEVADAERFSGTGFDLVAMFDCLHDMGDPVAAARRVRAALSPDGTWLLVEPNAAEALENNLHPVGRLFYAGSMFLCLPNALSQEGGYALGAQAGETAIREVAEDAGFTRFRRAAETPFNLVYEIRP
jgi:ubiquinone/menaquinone biosynthesis C-methylase UbiE